MTLEITQQLGVWHYTIWPITVMADQRFDIKNGKPWVPFSMSKQIRAHIQAFKIGNRRLDVSTNVDVADLIPIQGCDVESLIRLFAEQQHIPLAKP